MGILNVTPDSFSNDGIYLDPELAYKRASQMCEEGADIIDIGGESSRPFSSPVSLKEELSRVVPVIKAIASKLNIPISIDTYKAEVARCALEEGADIVNDISAMRFDDAMASVVAKYNAPVVLMHMKGTPKDMQNNPHYDNLIAELKDFFASRISFVSSLGISKIIIDPGIGFGKTFEHNLEIIHRLRELEDLGKPILIGASRKSFIGRICGDIAPEQRLAGSLASAVISVYNGASIIRCHDVKDTVYAVKTALSIKKMKIL